MSVLESFLDRVFPSRVAFRSNNVLLAEIQQRIAALQDDIGRQTNQIAEVRLWLEKISIETGNALTTLDGRIGTAFNRLFNEALPNTWLQLHANSALLLESRARHVDRSRWSRSPLENYAPARPEPFDDTIRRVQTDFPSVSSAWRERLEATMEAFSTTKIGNAAIASDLHSRMFKSFVEHHIEGRVLDVGCGVFGRPFYLSDYPANLISGIEPLPMVDQPDFECVRGVSEFLPWPDGAFSTLINATSLDHSASLDKALLEMSRVLRPGGMALLWIGSTKGAARFEPDSPQFVPADQFHLFHFDVAWFEPMLSGWEIIERFDFAMAAFDHVFYALRRPNQVVGR
jgi:SAM-dependent methyltransferase